MQSSLGETPETSREVAIALKDAEREDRVKEILDGPFFDEQEWKPLGQKENNYGIVENQSSAPVPALVELVVNSYDAILMKKFHEITGTTDPDIESDDVPEYGGQQEALNEMFDSVKDELVEIRADGFKPSEKDLINFSVIDNGCGQPPEEFEETFLGLLDPGKYKQNYPFLQGQYGMGSSGVLQFCGGKSYKFICSSAKSNPNEWSWSLIRQNKNKNRYEYATVNGEVPTFSGTVEEQGHGTFVKVYDYQLNVGKTIITGDERFQRKLERFLVNTPFPLTLNDTRYESTKVTETTTSGLVNRIEDRDYLVQEDYTTRYNFDHDQLGVRDIRVITFKDDEEIEELVEEGTATQDNKKRFVGGTEHREMAVLYTVNGQTHGKEGSTFIRNRCNKPRVGKDTLVLIDFSDIEGTDLVDLFQPTRDRLKKKEIGQKLREGVEDAITNDDWLKDEESRRRQKLASDETDEILDESLEGILEEDPDLQRFFESGEKAGSEKPADELGPYTCPDIPDTFEILETYDPEGNHEFYDGEDTYEIEVPINRSRQLRCYLNAPNDYFEETGELRAQPTTESINWMNLNRGLFTLSVKAPESYKKGDILTMVLNVTRPEDSALTQRVKIKFTEEQKTSGSGDQTTTEPKGSEGIRLPNIIRVEEEDWEDHEFDEQDIVNLQVAGDTVSDMDIYVNVHAAPVRRFYDMHDLRQSGKEFVEERYVMAVGLYSVSMYIEYEESFDEDDEVRERIPPEEMVKSSMDGLGQVLLYTVAPKQLLSEY
jgi:hypothetical protein